MTAAKALFEVTAGVLGLSNPAYLNWVKVEWLWV
jgi:hypothetical protein